MKKITQVQKNKPDGHYRSEKLTSDPDKVKSLRRLLGLTGQNYTLSLRELEALFIDRFASNV